MSIDELDIAILNELTKNARISASYISQQINLSVPAVSERIKRLKDKQYIEQYTTILNLPKFNINLVCFTFLTLRYTEGGIDRFKQFVDSEAEILECHQITGEYEYLLKIATANSRSLAELLEKLRQEADVLTSSTSITLGALKNEPSIRL
ncbi:MAG TPA: Lrp/AsnC family transcriptional regulator [Tissierellia bacterium]|nr:Lrp/AsnC family transcriptional regulator [Tissierellia bacterium]